MSSLAELRELVGFFSYSREDDEAFKGTLSALRDAIQRELSAQLGRSKKTLRLWQDQAAISPGELWEKEIKEAVDQSFFFIPIVTPRSIHSKDCKFEFEAFLAREKALGRNNLVFPILYISVAALEDEAKWRDDPALSTIVHRQYLDWRTLRHLGIETTEVREQIERFCLRIVDALIQPWSSEERERIEEAKARQQAEREERRLEAEAKRRAEEEEGGKRVESETRRRAQEEHVKRRSDIFISYAREDQQRAEMLAQILEGHGWSIFWDRTIPIGKTWRETIGRELNGARCVIVLWSKTSIESDWVQEEADHAKRRGVLVPVLIEDVQLPIGFGSIQAAHLENWDGTQPTQPFRRLIADITALIGQPSSAKEEGKWAEAEVERKSLATSQDASAIYSHGERPYYRTPEYYEKAAGQGNVDAMTNLGVLYADGQGVAQDYVKAREWYEKAAAKGDAYAMSMLGVLYDNGRGVAQDYVKAREWYEKAAAKGEALAMRTIGVYHDHGLGVAQDYAKAREWYEKAAANGDVSAMRGLGVHYEYGRGVAQDYAKAREWYQKAAERGDAYAMANLGVLYDNGRGVAQDYAKAHEWYERASDRGEACAMTNLGELYEYGRGVAQDYVKAREWYQKAADNGDAEAKERLKQLPIR